ncbi:MAG: translation initiation factor IF-1 [Bdellovibrionaceae bacterium]|nr:translation initiation factor IF-1 [Pseudobdellovibrionaceae bacterium]
MAKSDLAQFDGLVTDIGAGGLYKVQLEKNKVQVSAKLCGKMRRYNIQVVLGDRVTVGFSPQDLKTGLIIYRYR